MLNPHKIFKDSINGPQCLQALSVSECFTLMSIHNKKYIEALVECGNTFDLYTSDNHRAFGKLGQIWSLGDEQVQLIEVNNIYAQNANFLFPNAVIDNRWIESLIGLHQKGFLNLPPREKDGQDLLSKLQEPGVKDKSRQVLAHFPVLIPCLNQIHSDVRSADKHFHTKTPQYARYAEALLICKNDPKAMKSIHEVYASLIYVDETITHFHSHIIPGLKSEESNSLLIEFLNAIRMDVDEPEETDRAINEMLQFSEINMLLNWIFKASRLRKAERIDFLRVLALGKHSPSQVRQYILDNDLFF